MGLAASQARFLAITARKADLEFRSLEVAQNKLSITQSLADVTDQYQKALNTTKLIWSNTDDLGGVNDFSYSSLMYPSALNNYQAYLLTNRAGKIILDDKYAKAAAVFCPDGKPCSNKMTVDNYLAFINALGERGAINEQNRSLIENTVTGSIEYEGTGENRRVASSLYDRFSGYGSPSILSQDGVGVGLAGVGIRKTTGTAPNQVTYTSDLNRTYLFAATASDSDYPDNITNPFPLSGSSTGGVGGTSSSVTNIRRSGALVPGTFDDNHHASEVSQMHLMDLFTSNVTYSYTWAAQDSSASVGAGTVSKAKDNITGLQSSIRSFLTTITKAFTNNTNVNSGNAKLAYEKTLKQFFGTSDFDKIDQSSFVTSNATSRENSANLADTMAQAYNKAVLCSCDYGTTLSISLSNLAKTFLTYYEQFTSGSSEAYPVGTTVDNSNFVTNNKYYQYENQDHDKILAMCIADFYMQMFNNICINGWELSETVSENKSLEQLVKNGTYFVSSLAPDNYFYQTRYNEIDYVVEVKDEDAITQAEIEYEKQKARLTFKEDKLDLEMKNLDAEIAELTTEYQSVQNLISKNIDKTFTYFQ